MTTKIDVEAAKRSVRCPSVLREVRHALLSRIVDLNSEDIDVAEGGLMEVIVSVNDSNKAEAIEAELFAAYDSGKLPVGFSYRVVVKEKER